MRYVFLVLMLCHISCVGHPQPKKAAPDFQGRYSLSFEEGKLRTAAAAINNPYIETAPATGTGGELVFNGVLPGGYLLKSKPASRDVELTLGFSGELLLRATASTAIYVTYRTNYRMEVGYVVGYNTPSPEYRAYAYIDGATIKALPNYPNERFTISLRGFDIQIRYGSAILLRQRQYHVTEAGKILFRNFQSTGWVNRLQVTHLPRTKLFSNTDTDEIDLRDFGVRSGHTTGSMSLSAPYTLTVADASGYAVGDRLIVETGGETDGKRKPATRGAKAVGGWWPSTAFPDSATLVNEKQLPVGSFAYAEDSRKVYERYADGWWAKQGYQQVGSQRHEVNYYINFVIGLAYRGRIVKKAGNVLTMDTPCRWPTRNAHVWYDNAEALNFFTTGDAFNGYYTNPSHKPKTLLLPLDSLAISEAWRIAGKAGWTVKGRFAGRDTTALFSPKGTPSAAIECHVSSAGITIRDLTLVGNGLLDGYGLEWKSITDKQFDMGASLFRGISVPQRGRVFNVTVKNAFTSAISTAEDAVVDNVRGRHQTGIMHYMAWQFVSVGSRSKWSNVDWWSPQRVSVFEFFGATDCKLTNFRSVNGSMALNSTSRDSFINVNILFTKHNLPTHQVPQNPVINLNQNAYPGSHWGNYLQNINITLQGYVDSAGNLTPGIIVQEGIAHTVLKNYRFTVLANHQPKAFTAGAQALVSTGGNLVVDNLVATTGTNKPCTGGFCIYSAHVGMTQGLIKNSTIKKLAVKSTVVRENNKVEELIVVDR